MGFSFLSIPASIKSFHGLLIRVTRPIERLRLIINPDFAGYLYMIHFILEVMMMWRRGILILFAVLMLLGSCSDQKKPAVDLDDIPWCRIIHPTWEDTIRVNQDHELVMIRPDNG